MKINSWMLLTVSALLLAAGEASAAWIKYSVIVKDYYPAEDSPAVMGHRTQKQPPVYLGDTDTGGFWPTNPGKQDVNFDGGFFGGREGDATATPPAPVARGGHHGAPSRSGRIDSGPADLSPVQGQRELWERFMDDHFGSPYAGGNPAFPGVGPATTVTGLDRLMELQNPANPKDAQNLILLKELKDAYANHTPNAGRSIYDKTRGEFDTRYIHRDGTVNVKTDGTDPRYINDKTRENYYRGTGMASDPAKGL